MKKEDINYELISKIEIHVKDTLFYLPGEIIKGEIILHPQVQINEEILHLTLKIMQYEFWEYINKEIKEANELENIYTTVIQEENLEFKINKEELPKNENVEEPKNEIVEGFENCSIIMKEDVNKVISIPFEIKLDETKILPTFQFQKEEYFLGIRHLILVECKEYNSSNYIGLFIGKKKDDELCNPDRIKETYMVGLGSLEIEANFPKLSITPGEEMNVDIKANSNLYFKKITKVTQSLYRNIKWVGYMKNTLLDKCEYTSNSSPYNEDKYGLLSKLAFPIIPIIESVKGGVESGKYGFTYKETREDFLKELIVFMKDSEIEDHYYEVERSPIHRIITGILYTPVGMIGGFFNGFYEQGKIIQDSLNLNKNKKYISNEFTNKIEKKEKLKIEDIKKFVYFNDNKVVGFIKFANDITPNINGYYFNCEYNVKIEVDMAGIIFDRNKYLKTQIDLYDSEEYIAEMKNILKN